jgi:hypothetical protein
MSPSVLGPLHGDGGALHVCNVPTGNTYTQRRLARPQAARPDLAVAAETLRNEKCLVLRATQHLRAQARRWRHPLTVVGSLLAVGAIGLLVASRWAHFARAATEAPWWILATAAALQTL